eukprot:CAMPEP_0169444580 /NCGR_PEP_ID=MMETSP1042-20121227/9975_1 /TAXON_ID=464988 /ORGANISM="Hemiselmis andersenii, Strain CCMP1180" /LENGTH=103 /DNA_ID=CAMNT_0009555905 /DNA_START=206 /DNA_END=516 /DNA_ORIENTATION=+
MEEMPEMPYFVFGSHSNSNSFGLLFLIFISVCDVVQGSWSTRGAAVTTLEAQAVERRVLGQRLREVGADAVGAQVEDLERRVGLQHLGKRHCTLVPNLVVVQV